MAEIVDAKLATKNDLEKINEEVNQTAKLSPVKQTLENMKKGAVITAPRYQKSSIRSTMDRIKDESHKRYSIKTINSIIQIKRVI